VYTALDTAFRVRDRPGQSDKGQVNPGEGADTESAESSPLAAFDTPGSEGRAEADRFQHACAGDAGVSQFGDFMGRGDLPGAKTTEKNKK